MNYYQGGRHRSSGPRGRRGGVRWSPRNADDPRTPRWDEGSPGVSDVSSSSSGNPHGMGERLRHGRLGNTLMGSENASLRARISHQSLIMMVNSCSLEGSDDLGQSSISHLEDEENKTLADADAETSNTLHCESVSQGVRTCHENTQGNGTSRSMSARYQFDIFPPKTRSTTFTLKPSLLEKNRAMRSVVKRSMEGPKGKVLRSGMLLLQNYISIAEQVKIVKTCRALGMGQGGFYQPGYRDGAKLNLHMMCLGKNWDPEERNYGSIRSIDGTKPPAIPQDFIQLVKKAMKSSHEVISEGSGVRNAVNILPNVSPDICLVNFYSTSGKLGLHQDRDESQDSLDKGTPVVSFSIGDSAEFFYGDQRDIEKAEKVVLESGDVLIFGGKSRHVFHGVATVNPNSAPKMLVDETNLRPGRLNLTFRQY
ncbi:Alpha-ketoglutarate-dependent dioxygenase AlkB-like protein [Drosera capensis]